jgi:hypothetical protein
MPRREIVERGLLEGLFRCTASRALQRQHLSFWIRHAGIRAHTAPFPRVQVFRLERAVKRE